MKMKYFLAVLLIFSVLSVVYSYAFKKKEPGFKIDLVRHKSPRIQIMKHQKQLEKYGYHFDWYHINKSSEPRTNDTISLFKYMDNEFYGEIVIGSPGQKMNVNFDTAWSLTWVLSKKCQVYENSGCKNHNLYDDSRSSYYKPNGTKYEADEGTYNFTGFYSYENISIAHSNVTDYLFIEMTGVPDSFQFDKADGVLGLGLKDGDYEPFIYTLYRQKKIKDLLFCVYLNRDRQSKKGGSIILGFIEDKHIHKHELKNKTIVTDPITYVPVDPGEYWQFSVDKINFVTNPKTDVLKFCIKGCKALVDTSSTQIVGPKEVIDAIHLKINAQRINGSIYTVDCDKVNKLPKLEIFIGNTQFNLTGKQYIMQEQIKPPATLCISAFLPNDYNSTSWVLGGAFLAQYYSIYNIVDGKIGFVRAA